MTRQQKNLKTIGAYLYRKWYWFGFKSFKQIIHLVTQSLWRDIGNYCRHGIRGVWEEWEYGGSRAPVLGSGDRRQGVSHTPRLAFQLKPSNPTNSFLQWPPRCKISCSFIFYCLLLTVPYLLVPYRGNIHIGIERWQAVLRIRDPVPFWPLDAGSGTVWVKNLNPDPRSGSGWTARIIFPRA